MEHECDHSDTNPGHVDCGRPWQDSEGVDRTYLCQLCEGDAKIAELESQLAASERRVGELVEALDFWGEHSAECELHSFIQHQSADPKCGCGFEAVLDGNPTPPAEEEPKG